MENLCIWAKPTEKVNFAGLTMNSGVATVHSVDLLYKDNKPYINVTFAEKGTDYHETTDSNGKTVRTPLKGCVLNASFTSGERFEQTASKLWYLFSKTDTVIDVSEQAVGIKLALGVDSKFVFDGTKKHLKDGQMQLQSEKSQLYEYANALLKSHIQNFYNNLSDMDKVKYKEIEDMYKDFDFTFDIETAKTSEGNKYTINFFVYSRNIMTNLAKMIALQGQQLVGKDVIVVTRIETNDKGFTDCVPKYVLGMNESNLVASLMKKLEANSSF